jgi:4-diphosphocytidyl-2-C-methyl-D-erythritol kinase
VTVLRAAAKLTWSLHVVGTRPDGYHLLDAEMVTLDLADTVELDETEDPVTRFSVATEPPAGPRDAVLGNGELIGRALELVGRRAHVSLTKRIPLGAGLGGGSADAAAVLRWAGRTDPELAVQLGADVPFCCLGGRAAVRGVGEVVESLEPVARTVTLALPAFGVDTAECYDAFDSLDDRYRHHPRNDLTAAAETVAPALVAVRTMLEDRSGLAFVLAGSGSTMYCEGDPFGLAGVLTEVIETRDGPVRLLLARTAEPSDQ